MNLRKFYLTISSILLVFLFSAGVYILNYMNTAVASDVHDEDDQSSGSFLKAITIQKKPVNILLLGGDKVAGNTDTMMLVNFNPSTMEANIISIPRDTRVVINGNYQKINYAYPHGGADLAIQTVSDLLGVNIKYYVYVDTKVFRNIIDLLGGVKDFYVPVDMDYDDPTQNLHIHIKKGVQDFDGAKAEQFMRFRMPNGGYTKEMLEYYDGSDLKRIEAQQRFLKELIRQKANPKYFAKIDDILYEVFENIETNLTPSEVLKMTHNIMSFSMDKVNFMGTIPGTTYDYSPWYYLCDQEETAKIMEQYFSGTGKYTSSSTGTGKKKSSGGSSSKSTKSTESKSSSKNNDVTKGNPSNADTSIKGSAQPKP